MPFTSTSQSSSFTFEPYIRISMRSPTTSGLHTNTFFSPIFHCPYVMTAHCCGRPTALITVFVNACSENNINHNNDYGNGNIKEMMLLLIWFCVTCILIPICSLQLIWWWNYTPMPASRAAGEEHKRSLAKDRRVHRKERQASNHPETTHSCDYSNSDSDGWDSTETERWYRYCRTTMYYI